MRCNYQIAVIAAALCVALGGSALAQSHGHDDEKKHDTTGSHGSMGQKAADSDQMKKMDHGGTAAGQHNKTSGHQHGSTKTGDGKTPSQIDTATSKLSHDGHYMVSIAPQAEPVAINTMHNWVLEVMTPDGKPVQKAKVSIAGSMPQHGHGLPTAPRVTENLGDGKYLVEGMRFNMVGWWALKLDIEGHHADTVSFNIILE